MNKKQREYVLSWILDIVFPRSCVVCNTQGTLLCTSCVRTLPSAHHNPLSYCSSLYSYKSPSVKKIILYLKRHRANDIAKEIASPLSDVCKDIISEYTTLHQTQKSVLIPIPVSRTRLLERGFNQSLLLGNAIKETIPHDVQLDEALVRVSHTKKQSTVQSKSERIMNMKYAFSAKKPLAKNILYIIIDDVTSTGATLQEAKRALQKAGARHVVAVTVAH
jgi:competence protein ComFC